MHLPTEEADLTKSIYVHNYAGNIKHEKVSCCISIRNVSLFTLNVDANNELKQIENEKRKSMCKWMKRKRMRMRKSKVWSAVKAGSSTPEGFSFTWQETTLPVIWTRSSSWTQHEAVMRSQNQSLTDFCS